MSTSYGPASRKPQTLCPDCLTWFIEGERHACAPAAAYDNINPAHYKSASGMEAIDVVEAFLMDKPYRWAPLKYLLRAGKKSGQSEVQELRKAIWWIEREIAAIEGRRHETTLRPTATPPFPIASITGTDDAGEAWTPWGQR
jgi:hypothetical protein